MITNIFIMNEQETQELFINPYYAISISSELSEEHEPMTSKENWVKVNTKLIREMGEEAWLERLLAVLEGEK